MFCCSMDLDPFQGEAVPGRPGSALESARRTARDSARGSAVPEANLPNGPAFADVDMVAVGS